MNPALLGGLALIAATAAMIAVPDSPQVGPEKTTETDGQERPVRPNRPMGFELSVSYPKVGRRPLGAASLVTRGQASMGFVTVGGFVRKPGRHSFEDGGTLLQVIAKAGGPNEFGSLRRVKLIRKGKLYQFDLISEGRESPSIQSGDTIEVPQKMLFDR